jgi:hypothetical protein
MSVERLAARSRAEAEHELVPSRPVFFLCLLTGLATFLAITYECIPKFRRKPLSTVKAVNPSSPPKHAPSQAAERFSRLCESVKDLPPKEQASRVRDYFGILGGARPAEGRGRKGKRP